jgi:hypothetical protein
MRLMEEHLEETESDLPDNLINILENLQIISKHLSEGYKLTKDNLAAVSMSILYDHMKIIPEAQKLMGMMHA